MTTSTTVIVYPDNNGGCTGNYTQTAFIWDWYNFDPHSEDGLSETASNQGYRGEEMGLAKPFEVFGESSAMRGTP